LCSHRHTVAWSTPSSLASSDWLRLLAVRHAVRSAGVIRESRQTNLGYVIVTFNGVFDPAVKLGAVCGIASPQAVFVFQFDVIFGDFSLGHVRVPFVSNTHNITPLLQIAIGKMQDSELFHSAAAHRYNRTRWQQ
jgi:hypothetical protein